MPYDGPPGGPAGWSLLAHRAGFIVINTVGLRGVDEGGVTGLNTVVHRTGHSHKEGLGVIALTGALWASLHRRRESSFSILHSDEGGVTGLNTVGLTTSLKDVGFIAHNLNWGVTGLNTVGLRTGRSQRVGFTAHRVNGGVMGHRVNGGVKGHNPKEGVMVLSLNGGVRVYSLNDPRSPSTVGVSILLVLQAQKRSR